MAATMRHRRHRQGDHQNGKGEAQQHGGYLVAVQSGSNGLFRR